MKMGQGNYLAVVLNLLGRIRVVPVCDRFAGGLGTGSTPAAWSSTFAWVLFAARGRWGSNPKAPAGTAGGNCSVKATALLPLGTRSGLPICRSSHLN